MAESLMRMGLLVCVVASLWSTPAPGQSPQTEAQVLDEVEAELDRAESIEAIKRVTYVFGYYRDAGMYDRALGLFDDAATYDFGNGQYVGKPSIGRLFRSKRYNVGGRMPGTPGPATLNNHIMMQPVVTLARDGRSAKGRFKELVFEGEHGKSQTYSIGLFENDYVRDPRFGWRIQAVRYCYRVRQPYDVAARDIPEPPPYEPLPAFYPKDAEGPDRQISYFCHRYPDVGIDPPFHFDHPVTGERITKP